MAAIVARCCPEPLLSADTLHVGSHGRIRCTQCGTILAEYEVPAPDTFDFTDNHGPHAIRVWGRREDGKVIEVTVRCLTCDQPLLPTTQNPSEAAVNAAVENHG